MFSSSALFLSLIVFTVMAIVIFHSFIKLLYHSLYSIKFAQTTDPHIPPEITTVLSVVCRESTLPLFEPALIDRVYISVCISFMFIYTGLIYLRCIGHITMGFCKDQIRIHC